MKIRIKDWEEFQHFKDRTPPWIKLYRKLLDDPDWHSLDGKTAKFLMMLWLLASEDKTMQGYLPDIRTISFRLRMQEKDAASEITKLNHWLVIDDINAISTRYQLDAPETETETETETYIEEVETESVPSPKKNVDSYPTDFESFWQSYPQNGASKKSSFQSYKRATKEGAKHEDIIRGVTAYSDYATRTGTPIAHATTWLNQQRWTVDYDNLNDRTRSIGTHKTDSPHDRMGRAWAQAAGINPGGQND